MSARDVVKHPQDAIIRAWLDGKPIQMLGETGWHDVQPHVFGIDCPITLRIQYRIRPTRVIYRVALMARTEDKPLPLACEPSDYLTLQSHPKFIRWLGDEQDTEA